MNNETISALQIRGARNDPLDRSSGCQSLKWRGASEDFSDRTAGQLSRSMSLSISKYPQFTEDKVPIEERFFMLEGRLPNAITQSLSDSAPAALAERNGKIDADTYRELEKALSQYLALQPSGNRIHFAASFAYADVPVGKLFEIILPSNRPEDRIHCVAILCGVIAEWSPMVMRGTSSGHRFVGAFEFPDGVPELIMNMEEVDGFMQARLENQVWLCGRQTWQHLAGNIKQPVGPERGKLVL